MLNSSYIAEMEAWYQTHLGQALSNCEIISLEFALPKIFGFYLLQMGGANKTNYLENSLVHHNIRLGPKKPFLPLHNFIQSSFTDLPFINNSLDAVLVLHTLEFAANPRDILNEIYKTLVPEGNVIIFCFNPFSLWGITKLFKKHNIIPWGGNFISLRCMRKLLIETGFTVDDYKTFCFRPPIQNHRTLKKLLFMEGLGSMFWPYFGASCMFIAKKVVTTLTPIENETIKHPKILTTEGLINQLHH